jgi:hypothetical protein
LDGNSSGGLHQLELARIYQAMDRREGAQTTAAKVLEFWKDADPEYDKLTKARSIAALPN